MNRKKYILAIDQGTSSTKSLLFDDKGQAMAKGSEPLHTHYLDNGFVEQDPEEIYRNVLVSVKKCLEQFSEKGFNENEIAAIGISNQRETFVIWDKEGKPLYNAVVWQCKRSVEVCEQLKQKDLSDPIREKTGLVIDPYFSATKLIWLFQNNDSVKKAVQAGNAFFGTIDTWLLYKLTNGKEYATDYTNASRTLFFNLHTLDWDEELISAYGLEGVRLPVLRPSSALFGETSLGGLLPAPVPVTAMIGDSHAAAFGEGCSEEGTAKATLGTGCSILMNIGDKPVQSANGMVTTICWSIGGRIDYALEGVIVSCGATIEWLKNELSLFKESHETEAMAAAVEDNGGVYLVPAFSGLGSPHWQMERRAEISGISFGTNKNHIVRAALESIPYQVMDVVTAMEKDAKLSLKELMADGGISTNQFVIRFLADLLGKAVATIGMPDVSALGAAYLAGLQTGLYASIEALKRLNSDKKRHLPRPDQSKVNKGYAGWQKTINKK
ncbi:MAG: glycerol kinase GlpK [Chitinophagaceae bacterium]|nr:glycerol kinase GlpK [Chitinophagaceae bacterium]